MEGYGTSMITHQEFDSPVKLSREEQAAQVRAEFPEASKLVDQMKALFGNDVQVLAMEEGGKAIKPKNYKADVDYSMWMSGDRFLELGKKSAQAEQYAKEGEKNAKGRK